jgi:ABC-type multidrug transport system fused ATPase/permease subunit
MLQDTTNARTISLTNQPIAVEFRDVHFAYDNDKAGLNSNVLNGLSFTVPVGHKVAIVGGSGSGCVCLHACTNKRVLCSKSTIVRLLFRFYDPQSGTVLVGNTPIVDAHLNSLRAAIGIVPQDCVLFHNTLYYNIAYGRPDATREQVEEAARMAGTWCTHTHTSTQVNIQVCMTVLCAWPTATKRASANAVSNCPVVRNNAWPLREHI